MYLSKVGRRTKDKDKGKGKGDVVCVVVVLQFSVHYALGALIRRSRCRSLAASSDLYWDYLLNGTV